MFREKPAGHVNKPLGVGVFTKRFFKTCSIVLDKEDEMMVYYTKRPNNGVKAEPEENWLIWFDGSRIEGCENALLLYGGDILLLKTAKRVGREVLDQLDFENWSSEDDSKWKKIFGPKAASNELRTAYRHFRQVNDQL